MDYRNYYDSYWKPLIDVLGMKKYRPHDTIHTCISLLTAAKVDEGFMEKNRRAQRSERNEGGLYAFRNTRID